MLDAIGRAVASAIAKNKEIPWEPWEYPQEFHASEGKGKCAGHIYYSNGEVWAIDIRPVSTFTRRAE